MSRVVNPTDEIRKLSSSTKSKKDRMYCVLLYASEPIAWSEDPNELLDEKAYITFHGSLQYPELLRITVDGESWTFDEKLTKKEASKRLCKPLWFCALMASKWGYHRA